MQCEREQEDAAPMYRQQWMALIGLALSAFIMNTSEFMPIGLLVDIAGSFAMTEAEAGLIVSIYAWAVALLSVPLMVFASRFNLKRLLVAVIVLFAAGQVASALAPSFALLVGARLMVAAAHAIFWSIASPLAVRVVGERFSSLAVGTIVTGSSIAMVCGLPLGRAVGLILGWRMTFACVAAVALVTLAFLVIAVPRVEAGAPFSMRQLPQLLKTPTLRNIYIVTALFAGAHFTCYSYIEPFLQQVAGFSDGLITFTLVLYGAAGVAGSAVFSRGYSRLRFPFMRAAVLGVVAAMALLLVASVNMIATIAVCVLWGAFYTAYSVAFQAEILSNAPAEASAVAMSAYSGIFNLGIGSGTAIGGVVVSAASIADVGLAGALIGAASFAVCTVGLVRSIKRAERASRTNATTA